MQPVFRFAPSPTGALHLGHAFSALTDFDLCRAAGGRFLLRIEDTDPTRCRPEYEAAIRDDLAGWGSPGRSRCAASRSTSPTTGRRSTGSRRWGWSIRPS